MNTKISFLLPPGPLRIGWIEADDVQIGPSSKEYLGLIEKETKHIREKDFVFPDHLQKGIRSLLKAYGFHPSGRNRPASEFLVKDIQLRGVFNSINNAVDINNHLSLISHLPISILDLEKTGNKIRIRLGREKETYVFNREGQELSLKNLLVISSDDSEDTPFGSPVKDSQKTKIFETTRSLCGVVYTSRNITPTEDLEKLMERFASLLETETKAKRVAWELLDAPF